MLIIEVWNGNVWKLAGTAGPGTAQTLLDYRSRDDTEPLRIAVEDERTTISTERTVIELRCGSEPWERMLLAKWMRAPMFCRLQHRSEPRPATNGAHRTCKP